MNHNFDVEFAKEYGVLEAVLISNFEFWIAKNKANGSNLYDGKYWVYNSARALSELFPYASEQQIKKALKKLREKKVLIAGEYNKSAYDKTLWYTFSDEFLSIIENKTIDSSNSTNRESKNDQPIPDINTDINTDNNIPPIPPKRGNARKAKQDDSVLEILNAYECSDELRQALLDFIEERKKKRNPVSDRALKLLLKNLDTLSSQEKEKIEIVERSIMNGWAGFFPLRKNGVPTSQTDLLDEVLKEMEQNE